MQYNIFGYINRCNNYFVLLLGMHLFIAFCIFIIILCILWFCFLFYVFCILK